MCHIYVTILSSSSSIVTLEECTIAAYGDVLAHIYESVLLQYLPNWVEKSVHSVDT